MLHQRQREHGDFVASRAGGRDAFLISDPDAIQHVLQRNHKNYVKAESSEALRLVLGDGLLTSEGEPWRRHRKLAQPAFHADRLDTFVRVMARATGDLFGRWDEAAATGAELDVHGEMTRLTFRIVGEALFSSDLHAVAGEVSGALESALAYFDRYFKLLVLAPRWLRPPLHLLPGIRRIKATLDRVVFNMIEERRRTGERRDDLLTMLMDARDDAGQPMTDRQIRDEVVTVIAAGHETTAVALSWALILLGDHGDAEQRVASEGTKILSDREPALRVVDELAYTARVVDEALRLYPPSWAFGREAVSDDEIAGYAVPAGSMVLICPYVLHRHPGHWTDPDRFEPERFAAATAEGRHRFAYLPFGGGPRICIGSRFALLEARLVLATLLSRYRLTRSDPAPVVAKPSVTLRPRGGLRMRIEPR